VTTPRAPSRQVCPLCATDDFVELTTDCPDVWMFRCRGPYHDEPYTWSPTITPPVPAGRIGIGEDLGVYDDLLRCVHVSECVEYGAVEWRYAKPHPWRSARSSRGTDTDRSARRPSRPRPSLPTHSVNSSARGCSTRTGPPALATGTTSARCPPGPFPAGPARRHRGQRGPRRSRSTPNAPPLRCHQRFAAVGGAELELPERCEAPRVPRPPS